MTNFLWVMLFIFALDIAGKLDCLRIGSRPYSACATALGVVVNTGLLVWVSILLWEASK